VHDSTSEKNGRAIWSHLEIRLHSVWFFARDKISLECGADNIRILEALKISFHVLSILAFLDSANCYSLSSRLLMAAISISIFICSFVHFFILVFGSGRWRGNVTRGDG
jgi:hypothetical protein